MNESFTRTRIAASAVALLLVMTAFAPVGIVSAQTVSISQTALTDSTVAPGETMTIEATIEYSDLNSPAIDVTLPDDWTVTEHTDDGGTYGPPQPAWAWLEGDEDGVSGDHTVTYTVQIPTDAEPGEYAVSAEGSGIDPADSSGVSDTDELTVAVEDAEPDNQPPIADAGADQTVSTNESVQLDATASNDPDGTIESIAWSQAGGPAVSLSDAGDVQPTFTAPDVSSDTTLTFEVTVTDDDGATDTDATAVTVQPNETGDPSVSMTQVATTSTTVAPNETVAFEATVEYTDVNSPAIDVTLPDDWTVTEHTDDGGTYGPPQPAWAWLEGDEDGVDGSHTVTYIVLIPDDEAAGEYVVSAEGSAIDPADGSTVSDTADLTVTVEDDEPANQAPSAAFTFSPSDPEIGETVDFDAADSADPDGTIVSYAWDFGDDEMASGVDPTHTYDDAGTVTVELTVTDDDGATDTTTQTIDVSEPPATGPGSAEISVTPDSDLESSTFNSGSFQVENTGEQAIESVTFDLSTTAMPDMVFDPDGTAGDQAGKDFTADSGASATGLVDGTLSQPHNGVDGDDGYDVLAITFDDFESGESFAFSADNDPTSIKGATITSQEAGPISGLELARATVTVTYADGLSQTAQLQGDGSDGGSQAALDDAVADAPSIAVEDVALDAGVLDGYHGAATVADADQVVTVSGPANADVTLLRVEAELELDNVPEFDGTPGYDIEAYEANKAEVVESDTATTGADGSVAIPVTLTSSTDEGGLNYFVAAVGEASLGSNVVVLELDPDADTNEPPVAAFDVSPSEPEVGESVTFDADPSSDDDGTIESYEWTIETSGPDASTLLDADFEGGSLADDGFTHDPMADDASAGVSDATSNAGTQSAFHHGDAGAIVSPTMDASDAAGLTVEYWIQKGDEAFSENPDAGADEDLVVEYLDDSGTWVEIDRVEDSVDPGATVSESVALDGGALHDGFQLRFRQQGGSIASGDFWHVDDVSVVAEASDGGTSTDTGETATHAFASDGEHAVTLTVTDDDGATDTTTQTIEVVEPADEPQSIPQAVASLNAAGDDSLIETAELQTAIDLWVEDEPVPGTDGDLISTTQLQELIDLWVEDEPVDGGEA